MAKRIYLIDDDPVFLRLGTDFLKGEGYVVKSSADPIKGLQEIRRDVPDLLLLDIRMPVMDGFAVCKELKGDPKTKHLPIIIISTKKDETDVVVGLELGADDYIRKPYQEKELLARVRALFRRHESAPAPKKTEHGPFSIDAGTYQATLDGKALKLTPKEFELLGFFMEREGMVLTRAVISETLWGIPYLPTTRSIDYHVSQLRKKLGAHGQYLKDLRGVGYRFEIE